MTIINIDYKKIYWVYNAIDFAEKFGLVEKIKEMYEIENIDDIYESEYFSSDEELIYEFLEESNLNYYINSIPDDNIGCYWEIKEVE